MKRIHFKNGSHLDVTQEVVEALISNSGNGGNSFKAFTYEGKTEIVINMQEIVFVAKVP